MGTLNTPTQVRAHVQSWTSTTVDFEIDWLIDTGYHPGPFTVTVEVSTNGGAYSPLEMLGPSHDPETTVVHEGLFDTTYRYRVNWYCEDCNDTSAWGMSQTIKAYAGTVTASMTMTDEVTVSEVYEGQYHSVVTDLMSMTEFVNQDIDETVADAMTMTDTAMSATTLKTNYAYYLADEIGRVYEYSSEYGSFNGAPISSYIKIKKTDFSDLYPVVADRFNTAYRARLTYVDKGQHFVTFYYSTDGGVIYKGVGKTIGTVAAPGKASVAVFDFIATGQFFNFKVESSTTTGTFQWIALDIDFSMGGEFFQI